MASQRQLTFLFGLLIAASLIFMAVFFARPNMFSGAKPSHELLDRKGEEAQRLHTMAIRDLRETQDEIARMKAHGIGMPPGSGQSGQAK